MTNGLKWIAGGVFAIALMMGCGARVGYRVYDPAYSDYHTWDNAEIGYYNQWTVETKRPHVDYRRLKPDDQREYWTWRHSHS